MKNANPYLKAKKSYRQAARVYIYDKDDENKMYDLMRHYKTGKSNLFLLLIRERHEALSEKKVFS